MNNETRQAIQAEFGPLIHCYLVKPPIFMPLAMVFNFFKKYVVDSYTFIPDAIVKNEDNNRILLPPEASAGLAEPDWGGISGQAPLSRKSFAL